MICYFLTHDEYVELLGKVKNPDHRNTMKQWAHGAMYGANSDVPVPVPGSIIKEYGHLLRDKS